MSAAQPMEHVELPITGMTCASCAARIERKLKKLDGVFATVNYATERAAVDYDPELVQPGELLGIVEAAGFRAALPSPERDHHGDRHEHDLSVDGTAALRRRLSISGALSLPVLVIAMLPPALQFDNWQWLSLTLASPVVVWGAWPFHEAGWENAKHATATMDTLISVGVLAAWLWSLYALFFGGAGTTGITMPFQLIPPAATTSTSRWPPWSRR